MTQATVPAVVATQRINGTILPGTIFTPDSIEDHADLVSMDAVREPSEAELLLHEKMEANRAAAASTAPDRADAVLAGCSGLADAAALVACLAGPGRLRALCAQAD